MHAGQLRSNRFVLPEIRVVQFSGSCPDSEYREGTLVDVRGPTVGINGRGGGMRDGFWVWVRLHFWGRRGKSALKQKRGLV